MRVGFVSNASVVFEGIHRHRGGPYGVHRGVHRESMGPYDVHNVHTDHRRSIGGPYGVHTGSIGDVHYVVILDTNLQVCVE